MLEVLFVRPVRHGPSSRGGWHLEANGLRGRCAPRLATRKEGAFGGAAWAGSGTGEVCIQHPHVAAWKLHGDQSTRRPGRQGDGTDLTALHVSDMSTCPTAV